MFHRIRSVFGCGELSLRAPGVAYTACKAGDMIRSRASLSLVGRKLHRLRVHSGTAAVSNRRRSLVSTAEWPCSARSFASSFVGSDIPSTTVGSAISTAAAEVSSSAAAQDVQYSLRNEYISDVTSSSSPPATLDRHCSMLSASRRSLHSCAAEAARDQHAVPGRSGQALLSNTVAARRDMGTSSKADSSGRGGRSKRSKEAAKPKIRFETGKVQ